MCHKTELKLIPSISFIGAGKASTSLGVYFKNKGFEIAGYLSKRKTSAEAASLKTESKAFTSLYELIEDSNVIWITTPDDQIETVVKEISELRTFSREQKIVLHASGVHTTDILLPAKNAGYKTAAAHPLLAFGSSENTVRLLGETWFAVEESSSEVSNLLHSCGNKTFSIDKNNKTLYHAAACVLSNYLVTLMDAAQQIFELTGLPEEEATNATLPLIESVIENLKDKSSKDALTGPIKRGDAQTISMHLASLQNSIPKMMDLYKVMGRRTMDMIEDYKLKDILE